MKNNQYNFIFKWHRIPAGLKWLAVIFAAFCWSFNPSRVYYSKESDRKYYGHTTKEPQLIGRMYCFTLGYLMETNTGNWYIKIGDLK